MKNPTDLESRINHILDSNIRIIQYSVYAVGLIGLAVVAKSVHIFSKFTSSKAVPREFVTKAVKLQGKVNRIEFSHQHQYPVKQEHQPHYAVRFHVEHIPIVSLWTRKQDKILEKPTSLLKIELAGVNLRTLDGANKWIQLPLESNPIIWFRLYGINSEANLFYASVFLKWPWWKFWKEKDLSLIVLKHGEGVVASYLPISHQVYFNDKYPAYYRKLLYCAIKNKKYN